MKARITDVNADDVAFALRTLKTRSIPAAIRRLAVFLLICASCCYAQDQNPSDANAPLRNLSLAQLGDIEVTTASKAPEEVWKTAAAIYVLTQEDIRRSGATSIPEVLRLAPGLQVERIDSSNWTVGIRGFGSQFSRSVLVLIDGRSVYTQLFAGVIWDDQDVMLEDVDRIEVIRGPGGTIWGANAVNGIINIITKSAKDTRGAMVTGATGTIDRGIGAARYGGQVKPGLYYRLYSKGFNRGDEFHPDGDPYDDWWNVQGGFRADWQKSDRDNFTLQGDIYEGERGKRMNVAFYNPPASLSIDGLTTSSGGNLLARWNRTLSADAGLQLQIYFDRTNRHDFQFGETRDTFDLDFTDHFAVARNHVTWGAGFRSSPSQFIQTQPTVDFLPHQETDTIYSVYVQDELHAVENKLTLTGGAKILNNNYTGFEVQPTARLLWTPTKHQSLWAAITSAVRTPSRLDTDIQLTGYTSTPFPEFLTIAGDKKFKSETLLAYELGYRVLPTPQFYIDFAGFYNQYDNLTSYGALSLAVAPPLAPPLFDLIVPYANGITGHSMGFEISPDWKPVSWWHATGSYSYLNIALEPKTGFADAGTVSQDEGTSPQNQIFAKSQFDLPKRFEFDQTYRFQGGLPASGVKAFHTVDLRIGWTAPKNFELSLAGQNLTRPEHLEVLGGPGPSVETRRTWLAKITWRWE